MAGGFVQNKTFRWWTTDRSASNLVMALPSTAATSIPTWAANLEGYIVYDSTNTCLKYATDSAWVTAATATAVSLDGAYNNDTGERTVTVDNGDIFFDVNGNYTLSINNIKAATADAGLTIDAEVSSSVYTDGILLTTTAGAITDGLDASDAGITNAINVGGNNIVGTTAVINFTNFDVDGDGNVTAGGNLSVTGDCAITGTLTAGTFEFGSDGDGIDVTFNTSTASDNVLWDESAKTMLFTDTEIHMGDSDAINFGAGSATGTGDFAIYSDGDHLYIAATADTAGKTLFIGDDTNDIDIVWESNTNSSTVTFDSSGEFVYFNAIDLNFGDNDLCTFGDGASSNGDFKIYSDGTHLYINAVANSDGATLYIADDTHALDVIWEGTTDGDQIFLDHGSDLATFTDIAVTQTESGTGTTSFDITNAATTVSVVEINATGTLGADVAGLAILASANTAEGANLLRLDQTGGTANAGAIALEIDGVGQAIQGIFSDVDATENAYTFHCGGATGSGDAVVLISSDGTIAAGASGVLEVAFTGSDANTPILISAVGSGTGVDATGLYIAGEPAGTASWHINLYDTKDDALGVCVKSHADSASPANADAIFRWQFYGEDSGSAATEYARLEAEIMVVTAGQEDGRFVFSCAANDGTLTQMATIAPRAGGSDPELCIGESSGTSYVTTPGESLTLDTNGSTNSGSITITAGANGDISLTPNGTGAVIADNLLPKYQSKQYSSATANTYSVATDDMLLAFTTDGDALTVTLPAATGTGRCLILLFESDDGNNVTVNVTGDDTFFYTADGGAADNGDNTITMADAGDYVIMIDALADKWLITKNGGCTLSGA